MGSDFIQGGPGRDLLCGGSGDDELLGNGDDDRLFGGEGVDTLIGGGGTNLLDQDGEGICESSPPVVSTVVLFPGSHTRDSNGDRIADPNDIFELDMLFTAGSEDVALVRLGANFRTIGPANQAGFVGETFRNVGAGETVRTDRVSDACMEIDPSAQPGDEIYIEFDVNVDGEISTFRAGPFVVGQVVGGQTNIAVPVDD